MISFAHVSFSYPDTTVLSDVCFTLHDGEFVGILGPNGGGKSTFLRLSLGLLKPSAGKIEVTDKNISYIAQTTSLSDSSFPATVKEVVSLGLVTNKPFFMNREKKKEVDEILKKAELWPYRNRLVNELSGGQMQRVKIAKALIRKPSLLVLDEPDAGMDEKSHENLVKVIDSLKGRTSILFVSHHPHDLEKADHIYFIEEGKIMTYQHELERGHHHVDL